MGSDATGIHDVQFNGSAQASEQGDSSASKVSHVWASNNEDATEYIGYYFIPNQVSLMCALKESEWDLSWQYAYVLGAYRSSRITNTSLPAPIVPSSPSRLSFNPVQIRPLPTVQEVSVDEVQANEKSSPSTEKGGDSQEVNNGETRLQQDRTDSSMMSILCVENANMKGTESSGKT